MKVKNVVKGVQSRYNITEITIIEGHKIHFSGEYNKFFSECDVTMIIERDKLLEREVEAKYLISNCKLFLFLKEDKVISEPVDYEPLAHIAFNEE